MRAALAPTNTRIIVTHYGGPEALRVIQEERPEPKPGEVRVRVLAIGVSLPDIMAREGIHPETPKVPYTPGWDLVGEVDRVGKGVCGINLSQIVAAMPIHGAYSEFICLPHREVVPVPSGMDAIEVVSLILNFITAYQMLHLSAKVKPGQRVLFHGASGGVGTALLQLGGLAELQMYGTCSSRGAQAVSNLGAIPIDYQNQDFVKEIRRLTGEGVDAVFDPIGSAHLWRSRHALRPGGRVVGYGNTTSLRGEGLGSGRTGRRNRLHGVPIYGLYILGGWLLPGRKRIVPYSIQTLKRLKPALFRQDLDSDRAPPWWKNQTYYRQAVSSFRGKTSAGVAWERRIGRQNCPRARRIIASARRFVIVPRAAPRNCVGHNSRVGADSISPRSHR